MKIVIDIPDRFTKMIGFTTPELEVIATAVIHGTPLPDDAEILTAEAYSELCLMASVLNDTKSEVKALKKRQWSAMEANVKNEKYNRYLAEYLKGYMCALSTVEGIIAENETHEEHTEPHDNDDCMFGDYMSPIV